VRLPLSLVKEVGNPKFALRRVIQAQRVGARNSTTKRTYGAEIGKVKSRKNVIRKGLQMGYLDDKQCFVGMPDEQAQRWIQGPAGDDPGAQVAARLLDAAATGTTDLADLTTVATSALSELGEQQLKQRR
jgi:hypothetical protein